TKQYYHHDTGQQSSTNVTSQQSSADVINHNTSAFVIPGNTLTVVQASSFPATLPQSKSITTASIYQDSSPYDELNSMDNHEGLINPRLLTLPTINEEGYQSIAVEAMLTSVCTKSAAA
ncbi:hypothetical protein RUND412_010964, partial [Rhizina undulata]